MGLNLIMLIYFDVLIVFSLKGRENEDSSKQRHLGL